MSLKYIYTSFRINKYFEFIGHVAEWLRRGLQILLFQFDSGRGLHIFIVFRKKICIVTAFLDSSVGRAVDC